VTDHAEMTCGGWEEEAGWTFDAGYNHFELAALSQQGGTDEDSV